MTRKTKLAIIGCGAITEKCHIPAAMAVDSCEVDIIVDKDGKRARKVAKKFGIKSISTDYRDIVGRVDGAVIALPHNLHKSVSIEILESGIHVLVEKPMAVSYEECEAMLSAAKRCNAVLAVGHMRHFLHSAKCAKEIIESGMLGPIKSFDLREGNVYDWPVSSDFFFRPESAGGGVLLDTGAHTLGLLIWWLGEVVVDSYYDDAYGGVEADCEIHLKTKSGIKGYVELSRTRELRNTAIVKGKLGQIEVNLRKSKMSLSACHAQSRLEGHGVALNQTGISEQGFADVFQPQIADFINAIQKSKAPMVDGNEGAKVVGLIEKCYNKRKSLEVPWLSRISEGVTPGNEIVDLRNKTILVTGGTGFIGGRLIERLVLEYGARVRVIVRNFTSASRIARFPIEMIHGDIVDGRVVSEAAEGCDVIFHCAYDFTGSAQHKENVSVKGSENVCKAALQNKVERLVHVSTFSVYGSTPDGHLNEDSPRQPPKDIYAKTKLAAEDLVTDYYRKYNIPVSVVQPTIVYGPYSNPWTVTPVKQLKTGLVPLVNGGDGLCNAVYIDDVVDAMILSAVKDKALGEVFLISYSKPISWNEFYSSFENVLGFHATISMSDREVKELIKRKPDSFQNSQGGAVRSVIELFLDEGLWRKVYEVPKIKTKAEWVKFRFPQFYSYITEKCFGVQKNGTTDKNTKTEMPDHHATHIPDQTRYDLFRSKTEVCIDKARKLLEYEPKVDFKKGMALTAEFLRWANYL